MTFVLDEEYHERNEAIWTLYDLRDAAAWTRAGEARRAWGRDFTEIHALDNDHVIIVFRPGGARRLAA